MILLRHFCLFFLCSINIHLFVITLSFSSSLSLTLFPSAFLYGEIDWSDLYHVRLTCLLITLNETNANQTLWPM